jgi:hypothetical protein
MRSPTQSTVWLIIACDRASKSNIGTRYLLRRQSMIRKKPAPHLMRGGHRFSEKIMLNQKRWSKMAIRRKAILL